MEEKETIQPIEITWEELQSRDLDRYILVDTRGDEAVNYGMIPGAIAIPECELVDKLAAAAGDKKVILYCSRGQNSKVSAEYFREQGMDVYSLQGGYTGWLLNLMQKEQPGEKENERAREIEKSIRKKFHKVLFSRFAKAINEYDMIQENDKIAVCISGGKDSMLMAKLFQELKRHNKFPFELVFLVMDPGYSEANRKIIENNAKLMDIPITIFESQIFDAVYDIEDSPCYLCARMRRGYLYSHAKELGCNKIALGHHYDDVIETILMGMLYGGQVQTMMPKLHSTNFEGMELIRPMYLIREDDIKHWRDYNDLHFIQCACRFTENCATCGGEKGSKRDEMTELIKHFRQVSDVIEYNIFNSVHNINLRTVIGYHKDDQEYNFLDDYDEWGRKDADGEDHKGFFGKSES